jgi:hypothetical protein
MKKNKPFLRFLIPFLLLIACNSCKQNSESAKIDEMTIEDEIAELTPANIYPDSTMVISTHSDFTKKHYPNRVAEFKKEPLVANDIVFLGNSITEQGGDWSLKVDNTKARNRGISGDTTEGVIARLGEVVFFKPQKVFILIGINDLFRDDMSAEKVFNNILKIVSQIHEGSPETKTFVQTILPTTTENLKEKIKKTNSLLKNSEGTAPYKIISLHTSFVTEEDLMDMQLSTDGVHLNEKGYKTWVNKIINLI